MDRETHPSTPASTRRPTRAGWVLALALCLTLPIAGPTGCEDKVAPAPPPAGGKGKKGKKAAAPPPGSGLVESGQIVPEDDVPLQGVQDDPIPEPDANAIWAWIHVQNPMAALRLYGDLTGNRVNINDVATPLAELFGIDGLAAVDWSKPAMLALVGELDTPILVLSVTERDEFLTPMPRNAITDRQGNEYSYPISMTVTFYLSFIDKYAVLTTDWRHFPLTRERLAEILGAEHTRLVEASVRLSGFSSLNSRLARLKAPASAFEPGWADARASLESLLGDIETAELSLSRDGGAVQFQASLTARDGSPLQTLLAKAEPTGPKSLLDLTAGLDLRQWVWLDVVRYPLQLEGVVAPFVSTVSDLPEATAATSKADKDGMAAFSGPVLRGRVGAGAARCELALAPVKDVPAFRNLISARHDALAKVAGFARVDSGEGTPSAEAPPAPAPAQVLGTLSFTRDDSTEFVVDGLSDHVARSVRCAAPTPVLQHVANGEVTLPKELEALAGVPWSMAVLDFSDGEKAHAPATGALVGSPTGLNVLVRVPEEQLENLR